MKIYTKTGDTGKTSLFGGTRVPKYHTRIEAYGTIDELNAYIGLVRDQEIDTHTSDVLLNIQTELFTLGAMLATPPEKELLKSGKERLNIEKTNDEKISLLEQEIDLMNESLPPMTNFILPGGHTTVSYCHIARCICRRAERITTQLSDESSVNPQILMYLNRLSDYLFVLARKLTLDTKSQEIPWIPVKNK
ncbi:cob(I)alamin adenosyltransferase [Lutibacter agarilyticus]|uniref:Corrinoid adenosyltransferase n=1 Tax=Lutibacter agarilyticus TaxID=1109740 RepID=A0A238WUN5_9FLAO|nr:cob(I)yrinic acid a,c-diamide adenosyltransferase [Lutibacter agarilyticus]SNR50098.1 cob(I)alamin adenosyltransferase [Lutibacter agarilyticus]